MPDHDVTLKLESHNHMENYLRIKVNFVNEAEAAGIWILPQTEDNMKTTVWGRQRSGNCLQVKKWKSLCRKPENPKNGSSK